MAAAHARHDAFYASLAPPAVDDNRAALWSHAGDGHAYPSPIAYYAYYYGYDALHAATRHLRRWPPLF
jgi:hypothetical protein